MRLYHRGYPVEGCESQTPDYYLQPMAELGGARYDAVFGQWGGDGWAPGDLRGAGMAIFGLDEARTSLEARLEGLAGVYAGQTLEGRRLDLVVSSARA